MTTTIQPIVYQLTLTCGHEQLVSRPLPVGAGYPCWTACDREKPVKSYVAAINRYVPDPRVAVVVASGANNADMLHIQRVVDEANTKLTEQNQK